MRAEGAIQSASSQRSILRALFERPGVLPLLVGLLRRSAGAVCAVGVSKSQCGSTGQPIRQTAPFLAALPGCTKGGAEGRLVFGGVPSFLGPGHAAHSAGTSTSWSVGQLLPASTFRQVPGGIRSCGASGGPRAFSWQAQTYNGQ